MGLINTSKEGVELEEKVKEKEEKTYSSKRILTMSRQL